MTTVVGLEKSSFKQVTIILIKTKYQIQMLGPTKIIQTKSL